MKTRIFIFEGIVQAFIGIGAVIYGPLLIIDPSGGKAAMPVELLSGSPFSNYLIPGILLFLINGVGHIAGSFLSFTKNNHAGYAGILLGSALIIWIIVQVILIGYANWLQPFYLTLGILELVLSIAVYKQIKSIKNAGM
ncbi:hypothetical protein GF337_13190 [candidate division KSB1 bacterium]|nr:hypothetical protein [candidate division KSB1 bacterium]